MLQLIGTFVPVLGVILSFLLAYVLGPGVQRNAVLVLGPALTLVVCLLIGETVARNANLLFAVLLMGLVTFLFIYYPVLFGVWLGKRLK